jgi:hypothetical protein
MTYPRFSYYTRDSTCRLSRMSAVSVLATLPHLWKALLEPAHRGYSMRHTMTVDSAPRQRLVTQQPVLCVPVDGKRAYSCTVAQQQRCTCSSYSSAGLVRAFDDATIDPVCLPGKGHILQSLHGGEAQDGGL